MQGKETKKLSIDVKKPAPITAPPPRAGGPPV